MRGRAVGGPGARVPVATPPPTVQPIAASGDVSGATLLPQDEAAAVLGLPLDGQAVADVPRPPGSVCRTHGREICTSTAVNPVWPVEGVGVVVTVDWFVDPPSARAQHDRNVVDAARGSAVVSERGAAVVAGPDRTVLLSIYRRISVDAGGQRGCGRRRAGPRRARRRRPAGACRFVDARSAAWMWVRPSAGEPVGPFLGRKPLPVVPAASETRNHGSRSR